MLLFRIHSRYYMNEVLIKAVNFRRRQCTEGGRGSTTPPPRPRDPSSTASPRPGGPTRWCSGTGTSTSNPRRSTWSPESSSPLHSRCSMHSTGATTWPENKATPPKPPRISCELSCRSKHVLVFKWPPNHKILSANFPRQFICKREMKTSNTTISSAPRRVRSQTNTQSTPQLCLLFWWGRVRGSFRAHISRFWMAWMTNGK